MKIAWGRVWPTCCALLDSGSLSFVHLHALTTSIMSSKTLDSP